MRIPFASSCLDQSCVHRAPLFLVNLWPVGVHRARLTGGLAFRPGQVSGPVSSPTRISTVNGSPALLALTPTLIRSPAALIIRFNSPSLKPSVGPQLRAHPFLHGARAGRERGPAAGTAMRAASATAFGRLAAWCSACDSSATSTDASLQRQQLSSSPLFQTALSIRGARARPSPARAPSSERSTAMTCLPSVRLRSSDNPRRNQVGHRHGRQQQTQGARPSGPAASRHQLARVVRAVGVEVLLAQPQHFLEPRVVGGDRAIGRRRRSNCASSAIQMRAWRHCRDRDSR